MSYCNQNQTDAFKMDPSPENITTSTMADNFLNIATINAMCDQFALNLLQMVSITLHTVYVAAFILGVKNYLNFQKYSVLQEKDEDGKKQSKVIRNLVIKGQWLLSILSLLQAPFSLFNPISGLLLWPLTIQLYQFNQDRKFSTERNFWESLPLRKFWIVCVLLISSQILLQAFLFGLDEKIWLSLSLSKCLILWGIIILHGIPDQDDAFPANYLKQWSIARQYLNVNAKAKWCLVFCLLAVGIEGGLHLYSEIVTKKLLNSISLNSASNAKANSTSESTIEITASNIGLSFRWDLLLMKTLLSVIMFDICTLGRNYLWEILSTEINGENQIRIYRRMQHLSLRWHQGTKSGEMLGILRHGSNNILWFLKTVFFNVIPEWIDVIVFGIYASSVYPKVINVLIFLTTTILVALHFFMEEKKADLEDEKNEAADKKLSEAIDSLTNYETVKYFTNESYEEKKFADALKQVEDKGRKQDFLRTMDRLSQSIVQHGATFLGSLLCYWVIFNGEGDLTLGDYHMFGRYIFKFYYPFQLFGYLKAQYRRVMKDVDKLTQVLEGEAEVGDGEGATELVINKGEIRFDSVDFSYVPERQILFQITFHVPAGKTYAFVGPTGSGKSTMIRLLFRFYDPASGSILIDEQNLKSVTVSSLRKAIAVIPQDTVLFHQSIKDNILYGNLSSKNPEEDVIEAAKCAAVHDCIQTYPEKYETVVGTRGLKLSGGEKQRVSIARAVMKNAPILLMDEASSSLDSKTEKQIQATLEFVCKNRTTLIIAHRLSTVMNADKILVLNEGRIVESGSHNELLEENGLYAKMWRDQITEKEL